MPLPLTLRAEQVITTPSYFQPFAHFMELKGRNHTLAAYQAISMSACVCGCVCLCVYFCVHVSYHSLLDVLRKDITSVDVSSNEVATSLMSQVWL